MNPFGDWMEALQELLQSSIEGFAFAAWGFIEDAFSSGSLAGDASEWWVAVVGGEITTVSDGQVVSTVEHPGMVNVVVMAMLPILIIFVVLQLITSAVRSSTVGMIRAATMGILGIPAVYLATGVVYTLIIGVDLLTEQILNVGNSENDGVVAVMHLFGLSWDESGENTSTGEAGPVLNEDYVQWEMATIADDPGRALFPWIVAAVFLVCGFLLMLMMVFRLAALLVLTTFGPIPIFALASDGAKSIFSRWAGVVVALLLAKPAAAVIVRLAAVMTTTSSDWFQMAAGFVLLLLAAAAPLFMLTLIAFMTGGASEGVERAAVGAGQAGQRSMGRQGKAMANRVRGGMKTAGGAARGGGGGGGKSSPQPVQSMGNSGGNSGGSAGGSGGGSGRGSGGGSGGSSGSSGGGSSGGTSGGGSGSGRSAGSGQKSPTTSSSGSGAKTGASGSGPSKSGSSAGGSRGGSSPRFGGAAANQGSGAGNARSTGGSRSGSSGSSGAGSSQSGSQRQSAAPERNSTPRRSGGSRGSPGAADGRGNVK